MTSSFSRNIIHLKEIFICSCPRKIFVFVSMCFKVPANFFNQNICFFARKLVSLTFPKKETMQVCVGNFNDSKLRKLSMLSSTDLNARCDSINFQVYLNDLYIKLKQPCSPDYLFILSTFCTGELIITCLFP